MYRHLSSSTYGHGATNIHSKETQEKTPSQTRGSGWTSWVFMTRDLGDRTGPARPWQVTCTLEVPRWSASSLRHSPPDCAAELVLCTQPSRLGAQREGTRSSNHRGAATIPRRNHHTTKTKLQLETTSFHEATKRLNHHKDVHHKKKEDSPGVSCALISPGVQRFAPPRFWLRLPSSSCENLLEKGRSLVPSA